MQTREIFFSLAFLPNLSITFWKENFKIFLFFHSFPYKETKKKLLFFFFPSLFFFKETQCESRLVVFYGS